jgi:hypothetical protein
MLHTQCYQTYMEHATAPDKQMRLYVYACAIVPWPRCKPLELKPRPNMAKARELAHKAYPQSPQTAKLPSEVEQLIIDELASSLLPRAAAVEAAEYMDQAGDGTIEKVPLNEIAYWNRGGRPIRVEPTDIFDMRLTIDAKGIAAIDRKTPGEPQVVERDDKFAYGHVRIPPMQDIIAYFMVRPPFSPPTSLKNKETDANLVRHVPSCFEECTAASLGHPDTPQGSHP